MMKKWYRDGRDVPMDEGLFLDAEKVARFSPDCSSVQAASDSKFWAIECRRLYSLSKYWRRWRCLD
jgi:hypothetical protein